MQARWHASTMRHLGITSVLFAFLALAGCQRPADQVPAVQGEAPIAATPATRTRVEGFGLASAYAGPWQGDLALVLEFSQPLVASQDFDKLVTVTDASGTAVEGSWALDEESVDTLRFPYVKADARYKVQIDGELTAADGKTLGQAAQQEVYTGPLEPSASFASQGSVLPARETRGLPVVSINSPEVDVEFLRVRDSEVANFFAAYQKNGERDGYDLDPHWGWYGRKGKPVAQIADSVYLNRFVLGGKPNERTLSYLPIQNIAELAQPGLYFAVMKNAGHFGDSFATSFFFVSDIGLHTRAYKDALFVHTASLKSGAPLANVSLAVLDAKGETVASGQTDGEGNAQLAYRLKADQVLVARSSRDVSLLPFNRPALDLSDFAVAGRRQGALDVFAWSGRDLYRPGETVRLSALLRDNDGKPTKAQPLFVTLKQPDGRPFAEARLEPRELNYFEWSREVPADAPTGRWQVEFRSDPKASEAAQSMTVRIEEFLPERMKLDLTSPVNVLQPGQTLPIEVQGDYLYGAPAAGNRFTARLTLAVDRHPVASQPDFWFGDPGIELPKEAEDVIDASLDEHGRLEEAIALEGADDAATPVAAIVAGSLFETGGRPVSRTLKRTRWPAEVLVGARPLFDPKEGADANAAASFELVRSNAAGEFLPGSKLRATLVRERRDYQWTWDSESGWHFDYRQRFEDVETREFDLAAGKASKLDFPVEWGNYRLDVLDPATGLTMRMPFFAGWSWDDDNRGGEARPDKVKLALDKTGYRAGDTLKVTVTPPQAGPGVLIVESDHLLYTRNIDARPGATFEIPVTADWERHDVYLTALVFRGGSATEKITPARAVGEAWVPMDRRDRKVEVALEAPAQMQPERDLEVTVKVPQLAGQKAQVTVSAVDVGILNITRFARPDATAWFFAQRALGIDAYDLYGRVIESFDGALAKLRFGGDLALASLPQSRRPTARVQTIDLFSGAVTLDAKGEAKVALHMPDFNGTVRVTALAYGEDRYGSTDAETIVRAPLVAEVSTPRVLAPGDEAELTLDLSNFSGAERSYKVQVTADPPLAVRNAAREVRLADQERSTLNFPLSALEGYGVGRFHVTASSGDYRIERHFETVVRAAWPGVVQSYPAVLERIEPVAVGASVMGGLLPDSVNARLTVSSLPPLPFAAALEGVLDYPYGCVEQTTSKGSAALLLDEATASRLHVRGLDADARKTRVDGAIARIGSMQTGSGHFSFWGGDTYVNPFLTPYVVEFLQDAREAGFMVPDGVLQKALERLNEDLLTGGDRYYSYEHSDHLRFAAQAWAGFVLARVNRAPLGTLRTLFDNQRKNSLTALPLVHLGVALKLMGDERRAQQAVTEAFAKDVKRPWYLGDYGSELRDTALMVELAERYGLAKPSYRARVFELARSYADRQRRNGRLYLSTQEQVSLGRLGKQLVQGEDKLVSGTLTVGRETSEVAPQRMWSQQFGASELTRGVRFQPQGTPPLFTSTDIAGIPRQAPAVQDQYVAIERRFYTLDGKPWEPAPLREGDSLVVGLRIQAREAMPDALLVDLLPGGLEVENFNLTDAKQWADVVIDGITLTEREYAANVRHEEFRDDRYVASLDISKGQTAKVFYLVRAVSPGRYRVPPPQIEDMYKPEVRGTGAAVPASITVVHP